MTRICRSAAQLICFCCGVFSASSASAQWTSVGTERFTTGRAWMTSMAIDIGGVPYVAYEDSLNGFSATVMKYNGSAWVNVGNPSFSAGEADFIRVAISNAEVPYVCYTDFGNGGKATVMKYDGSAWAPVGSVGFSDGEAHFTTIAIDEAGTPYLAYSDMSDSGKIHVVRFDGSNWIPVGGGGFSVGLAYRTAIALTSTGVPYVIYNDTGVNYSTVVKKFNGVDWETVGAAGFSGHGGDFVNIAIGNGDTLYTAYSDYDFGTGGVTVKKFNGTDWVTVGERSFSGRTAFWLSLAISDAADGRRPYVAYEDYFGGQKATVMRFDGSNWVDVGGGGFSTRSAAYVSMAIAPNGGIYVSYADRDSMASTGQVTVMKYNMVAGVKNIASSAANSIRIFPNPGNGAISISAAYKITSVVICNPLGKVVYSHECNADDVQADVSSLPAGVYFVRLNGREAGRFVKE